ncbi:MAG: c-type cytochrome domain-containing protein [Planctomycetota bacterium]
MNVWRLTLSICSIWLLMALGPKATGQENAAPDPLGRLEALLKELKQTDPKAWDAKVQAMQAEIAKQKAEAAQLREQAQKLEAQAAQAEQRAKAIQAEIEKLAQLRALIEPMAVAPKPAAEMKPAEPAMQPKNEMKPKNEMQPKNEMKPPAKPAPEMKAPAKEEMKPAPKTAAAPKKEPGLNFEDHVLTIFEEHCVGCHNPDDLAGSLDLTSFASLKEGGGSGAVITAGDPDGSRLYRLVAHLDTPTMPPEQGKITDAKVQTIRDWLAQGAAADAASAEEAAKKAKVASDTGPKGPITPTFDGPPPMPESLPAVALRITERPPIARDLAASPRAPLIAVPGIDQVLLYHTESLELLGVLPFPFGRVNVLRFTVDGSCLLAAGGIAGKKGGAVLYDVRTGAIVGEYGREYDEILAAAISPGQSLVAIGGPSKKVRVYETATSERRYELTAHQDWILALDISPDGNYLASADRAGIAMVWQADTGRDVHVLRGHQGPIQRLRFRPDAQRLATVSGDGTVRQWELSDGRAVGNTPAHGGGVLGFCWRGADWASAGADGSVKLWDAAGKGQGNLPGLGDWIYAVSVDASGQRIFTGAWDGRVRVYSVEEKKLLGELGGPKS